MREGSRASNGNLPGGADYEALDLPMGIPLCGMPGVSVEREQSGGEHDCEVKSNIGRPSPGGPGTNRMRSGALVDLLAACSKVLREHHYSLLGPNNLDEPIPVEWFSVGTNQGSLGNQMRDMTPIFEEQSNGGATDNVHFGCHGDPLSEGALIIGMCHSAGCLRLHIDAEEGPGGIEGRCEAELAKCPQCRSADSREDAGGI